MLLSTKLVTALSFSALKLPVAKISMAVGLGAAAWGTADMAQRPSVGGDELVAQHQVATTQKSAQDTRLHNEVQYIGDQFLEAQQRLQHQADEQMVQAF